MTDEVVEPPGAAIREVLTRQKWTYTELARRTGLSKRHVTDIMNGKQRISVTTALKFEEALGMSAKYLLYKQADYDLFLARRV